jgi:hypothetical protein
MPEPQGASLPGTSQSPVQPNDAAGNRLIGFSLRFWTLLILTGIGAGIGAGLLMELLRAVQHLSYSYKAGTFLEAVQHAPIQRRLSSPPEWSRAPVSSCSNTPTAEAAVS